MMLCAHNITRTTVINHHVPWHFRAKNADRWGLRVVDTKIVLSNMRKGQGAKTKR